MDTYATVGISRTFIDNTALEHSVIARYECVRPGTTDTTLIDSDFLVGIGSSYGYTKDNCQGRGDYTLSLSYMYSAS